jgi:hypothetical protein
VAEDFGFDGEFGGVGELVAVGAEELDAVVLPGIVRGGDDDAGGERVRAGEEGDGGGGDDAGGLSTVAPAEVRPAVRWRRSSRRIRGCPGR